MNELNDNNIFHYILTGDESAMRVLYPRYQAVFMHSIREAWRNTFDEKDMIEAYMESIANFYIRVKSGKLTHLDSTVESYLIATGKYILIKEAKRKNKNLPIDNKMNEPVDNDNFLTQMITTELDDNRKERLRNAIAQLGKKCQLLLTLSFREHKTADDIVAIMNYSNLNTLYAAKARCLKELKDLIKN